MYHPNQVIIQPHIYYFISSTDACLLNTGYVLVLTVTELLIQYEPLACVTLGRKQTYGYIASW